MRFLRSLIPSILLVSAGIVEAASSWNFDDATISVNSKTGAGLKDKLSVKGPLSKDVEFGPGDSLKVLLTATENGKAKRPHQAFLLLQDQDTGLEATFPVSVKETGKGKVDFSHKDLPLQLLGSSKPLRASLLVASFGQSVPLSSHVFNLEITHDPSLPSPKVEKPLRYGKLAEIHHIFRPDPKSGPIIITLVFMLAVLGTLPVLFGAWALLGANISHLEKATSAAPIAHTVFFGSILAMEGLFFLYYKSWTLFQVLPVAGVIGVVTFLSGSKALSEVQSRRFAGER